jgi:hypothetical protein
LPITLFPLASPRKNKTVKNVKLKVKEVKIFLPTDMTHLTFLTNLTYLLT